jgi:pimeloyl-ACP methyl ester carboxylesterase
MRRFLLLAVIAVALTGCSSSEPAASVPPPCDEPAFEAVTFTNQANESLDGYVAGTGATGVVLASQLGMDGCSWKPYALDLIDRGYRVIAFDYAEDAAGKGFVSGDVIGAATYLRSIGVANLVLIGGSRGGSAVVVAGSTIDPPVAAVVSLSGPGVYRGAGALDAAPNLTVPVLYVAGQYDGAFAADAQALYDATPGDSKQLLLADSGGHGEDFALGNANGSGEVNKAIFAFLAKYAPVT